MKNQVFRYGKLGIYNQISALSIMFSNLFIVILIHFRRNSGFNLELDILVFSFFGVFLIAGVMTFVHHLTLKVSLSNESITFQSSLSWGWKLLYLGDRSVFIGEIPYTSIEKIEDGDDPHKPLKIKINNQKQPIYLNVKFLEKGEEFIKLFTSFLKTEQINEPNKKIYVVNKAYSVVKLRLIVSATMVALIFLMQLSISYIQFYKSNIWDVALKESYVYSISHDTDGSIWAITQEYQESATVWHISNDTKEQWIFPKELCPDCYFQHTGHDSKNLPRVISRDGLVYAWNGNQWIKDTTVDIKEYAQSHDTVLWGRKNGNLAYIDFATNKTQEISAPSEAIASGMELKKYKVNQDGSILALYSKNNDSYTMLYKLKNQQWQLVLNVEDDLHTVFTLDSKDRVWALRYREYLEPTYILGYYDEENQVWKWQYVQSLYTDLPYIEDIAIDTLNRAWVSGGHGGNDFIQILEWSENSISKVEEYNSNNSNLAVSPSLFITNSGRLWFGWRHLSWIDTTAEKLPKPLPDWWVKNLDSDQGAVLVWWILILGVLFILFFESFLRESRIWEKEKNSQT